MELPEGVILEKDLPPNCIELMRSSLLSQVKEVKRSLHQYLKLHIAALRMNEDKKNQYIRYSLHIEYFQTVKFSI